MVGEPSQSVSKTALVLSAYCCVAVLVAKPCLAQHHTSTTHKSTVQGKQPAHKPATQNQMMMMLDQVETGHAQPPAQNAGHGSSRMGSAQGAAPRLGGMGRPSMGAIGAMGAMGAIGGGAMLHRGMTGGMTGGGGQSQFLQKLKQKFSMMQGMQGGGAPMGGAPMGGAAGALGRMPMGQQGMPMGAGGGGMQSQASMHHFTPGSILNRASGTTGGSGMSTPAAAAPATTGKSNMSDLERQMEQQYGR